MKTLSKEDLRNLIITSQDSRIKNLMEVMSWNEKPDLSWRGISDKQPLTITYNEERGNIFVGGLGNFRHLNARCKEYFDSQEMENIYSQEIANFYFDALGFQERKRLRLKRGKILPRNQQELRRIAEQKYSNAPNKLRWKTYSYLVGEIPSEVSKCSGNTIKYIKRFKDEVIQFVEFGQAWESIPGHGELLFGHIVTPQKKKLLFP